MISRLSLSDFRNHADALIEPDGSFVLLSGPNGVGKTNILEAVSILAPGRGLRRAPLGQMARRDGAGGFAVAARLADGSDAGVGTNPASPDRRLVRVNGATATAGALAERLAILWLTPAMDRLFTDSAGARRRFLDRLVVALEPGHARHAARYEAAMRARNKLLAEPDHADPDWLAALEAGMAEHGEAIASARQNTVAALSGIVASDRDDEFPLADLALAKTHSGDLAQLLRESRSRDAAAGRAIYGPHRHDLIVTHRAKAQLASQSSTGEQKALLIGLVLAHSELVAQRRGLEPILLLDEVAAHLDPDRRAALFERLSGRGQVWMTATESSLFDGIKEASRYHVADGVVTGG